MTINDHCQKCGKKLLSVERERAEINIGLFERDYSLCQDCARDLADSIRGFVEERSAAEVAG